MTAINTEMLVELIRTIVKSTVDETLAKTRTTGILTGTVEDLDDDLDVAHVRMDFETLGSDPTESDNYGSPGIIATTRAGRTFRDEQARVNFDGSAGAISNHVGIESRIVLPFGQEMGLRIILDGLAGTISFFDADDELVGYLDPQQWFIGKDGVGQSRLDPTSGLRLRDANDFPRTFLSPITGLQMIEPESGIASMVLSQEGMIISEPVSGEQLKLSWGSSIAVPEPRYTGLIETNPGSTHTTPGVTAFTFFDCTLRFSCASGSANATATYTPPAAYTELADIYSPGDVSLISTVATKTPVSNDGIQTFTNTRSDWTRQNGHSIVVRGDVDVVGGATVRDTEVNPVVTSEGSSIELEIVSSTVVEDDMVFAFVALAGDRIPVGWTTPEGWKLSGVQIDGLGTNEFCGSAVFHKLAGAVNPASEVITINMGTEGTTKVQATVVSVKDIHKDIGDIDIRHNNQSYPRGQIARAVSGGVVGPFSSTTTVASLTLTDVELKKGRDYQFNIRTHRLTHAVTTGPAAWNINIREGGALFLQLARYRHPTSGIRIMPLYCLRQYRPAVDEVKTFEIQLEEIVLGDSSIELAATAFEIVDMGATLADVT